MSENNISLAPWLQPGAEQDETTSNRFNGLLSCIEAVETALFFSLVRIHRAEATMPMRRALRGKIQARLLCRAASQLPHPAIRPAIGKWF
jgi:hypothetical protein